MFKISKIEKATFYIDNAMNAMEEFAIKERENIEERFKKNPSIKNKGYDVVKLDKRTEEKVDIRIGSNIKYHGVAGTHKKQKAIKITDVEDDLEERGEDDE